MSCKYFETLIFRNLSFSNFFLSSLKINDNIIVNVIGALEMKKFKT